MLEKDTNFVSETKYSLLITAIAIARELACVQVFQILFSKEELEDGQMTHMQWGVL